MITLKYRVLGIVAAFASLTLVACSSYLSFDSTNLADNSSEENVCVAYHSTEKLQTRDLQVTNWNVFKGQKHGWDEEISRRAHVDALFLIQEAPQHDDLHASLGEANEWRFAPGFRNGSMQTGVLTSSSTAANMECRLQHMEPWLGTPKAALITRYGLAHSDKQLLVANIHAINFSLGIKEFARQISDITDILRLHDGPIILAGDFNTWNEKRLVIVNFHAKSLGLSAVEFEKASVKKFRGYPLDHVFYRQMTLEHHQVWPVDSSDHNLLQAQFRL